MSEQLDVIWEEAPGSVIDLAKELIHQYHPDLMEARIGFLMRKKQSFSKGKLNMGHAAKVSDQNKVLMDYDFIIWLDGESYADFGEDTRRAVIDHELCHCVWEDGKASLRHHDFEEFNCVIRRHGLWNADLLFLAEAIQKSELRQSGPRQLSMLPRRGVVESANPIIGNALE